jgi:hypothetical protein
MIVSVCDNLENPCFFACAKNIRSSPEFINKIARKLCTLSRNSNRFLCSYYRIFFNNSAILSEKILEIQGTLRNQSAVLLQSVVLLLLLLLLQVLLLLHYYNASSGSVSVCAALSRLHDRQQGRLGAL